MLFPLDPSYLLDNEMSLLPFTTYVNGILGLGGKASKNKLKYTSFIFPMKNITILGIFPTDTQKEYSKVLPGVTLNMLFGHI